MEDEYASGTSFESHDSSSADEEKTLKKKKDFNKYKKVE